MSGETSQPPEVLPHAIADATRTLFHQFIERMRMPEETWHKREEGVAEKFLSSAEGREALYRLGTTLLGSLHFISGLSDREKSDVFAQLQTDPVLIDLLNSYFQTAIDLGNRQTWAIENQLMVNLGRIIDGIRAKREEIDTEPNHRQILRATGEI